MTAAPEVMRDRFADVAIDLLDHDPRVALVLADIGIARFADVLERHPDRVLNVGIREAVQIGVASGLALTGFRPIAHNYAPFLVERAFEQLKIDLSHQDAGAILVSVAGSYDAAHEGRTHQAPGDVALLQTLPDWTIYLPGHPDELERLLRREAARDGCAYVRLATQLNRRAFDNPAGLTRVREGTRGTVVAVGPLLDPVLEGAEGLGVTVLYTATVRPFDGAGFRGQLSGTDVVLVEPTLAGTSAPTVSALLEDVPHRLLALGVENVDLRRYGTPQEHAAAHLLDARGIRERLTRFLDARP